MPHWVSGPESLAPPQTSLAAKNDSDVDFRFDLSNHRAVGLAEPLRRSDYRDSRERLLEAASELIAQRGAEALSISEVARRAGLNRTTAYSHFARRADLAAAVRQAYQRRALEMLADRRPLEEWIDHVVDGLIGTPGMNRLFIHDLLEGNQPNREGWKRYTAWIAKIADERGTPEGPAPEFMAHFLISMVLMWPLLADVNYAQGGLPAARKALADEIKRLLLHGFVTSPNTRSGG